MSANILLKYFTAKHFYAILFVTARCQARCNMCFYSNEIKNVDKKNELTLSEFDKIASNFKKLPYLSVTGGEPTLRADLADIIEVFYQKANTENINISTNGLKPTALEETVRIALKNCPRLSLKVSISLDDINERHDRIRNYDGAFKLAMESYERLKGIRDKTRKPLIYITTVLTQDNQSRISEITDFIKKNLRVDGHNICMVRGETRTSMPAPSSQLYEDAIKKSAEKSPINLNNIIRSMMYHINLSALKKNGFYIPCVAGRKMVVIKEDGSVRPCETLKCVLPDIDDNMGNLRDYDYDIDVILSSMRTKKLLKNIREKRCACTFECANMCNVIFNPGYLPSLIAKTWMNR